MTPPPTSIRKASLYQTLILLTTAITALAGNSQWPSSLFRGGGDSSSSGSTPINSSTSTTDKTLRKPVKGMPSVFRDDEVVYDRYAACLAATEALRQTRDAAIQRASQTHVSDEQDRERGVAECNPIEKFCGKLNPASASGKNKSLKSAVAIVRSVDKNSMEYKQANAQYLINASKIVKALGLSVTQFNSLSREVNANEVIKERVGC